MGGSGRETTHTGGFAASLVGGPILPRVHTLITGGAGFIGSNLAQRLVADGHRVRVLDDLSTGFRENVADEVELIQGDVADPAAVAQAVDRVEVVFHQAAHRAVLRSVE